MIADLESNKKLSPIVTELFLRGSAKNYKVKRNPLFYHENTKKESKENFNK